MSTKQPKSLSGRCSENNRKRGSFWSISLQSLRIQMELFRFHQQLVGQLRCRYPRPRKIDCLCLERIPRISLSYKLLKIASSSSPSLTTVVAGRVAVAVTSSCVIAGARGGELFSDHKEKGLRGGCVLARKGVR